jgi:transcriptional regulator with XRE-family HTH domain
MEIGKRLAQFRDRAGLTQEALAASTGLTRPHIQKLESSAHSPSVNTLEALLRACDSTLAEFFESKIPNVYADAAHAELHRKLQEILESGDKSKVECMTTAVDTFYQSLTKQKKKKVGTIKEQDRRSA